MVDAAPPPSALPARLRVAFMGSPAFAVPPLQMLLERGDVQVVRVVSQPDKPAGRGRQLVAPAVKEVALAAGVEVAQPGKLRTPPFAEVLRPLGLDLIVVVAYGRILPPDLLAVPRLGCWNVHGSLLPRFRGAAPIQHAVLAGEQRTGVTLMQMDEGLDTGPMLLTRELAIADDDTAGTLFDRLAPLGAAALSAGLDQLRAGTLRAVAQDAAQATLAPILTKEQGRIDWARPAPAVRDHVRGMDPWPGAFTALGDEVLKLWQARLAEAPPTPAAPGTVLGIAGERLVVACGQGAVALGEGQLPGRRRMSMAALAAGRKLPPGLVLG